MMEKVAVPGDCAWSCDWYFLAPAVRARGPITEGDFPMAAEAAAAHAAQVNALKASGVIVRLEIADWLKILERTDRPLVVIGVGGVFKKHNQYLTSYRGLAFFATSKDTIVLPPRCEIVQAKSIAIPDV